MKTGLMRKLQHTWKLTSVSFVAFAVANAALTVLATVPLLAQFEINPDHYEFRDAEPFPSQEMSRKPVLPDMTPGLSSSIRWTSLPTGDRFSPMERVGRLGSPEEITSPGASSTSVPPLLRHAFWQGILKRADAGGDTVFWRSAL